MENSFEHAFLPFTSINSRLTQTMGTDVFIYTDQIVNLCFVGDHDWFLIDAGMPNSANEIISQAEQIYGADQPPKAIILTHGHFDHVGSIVELVEFWKAPVFAHELELPFLTGEKDYPPADPTVDGGWVSKLSPWFPNSGINLDAHIHKLPSDGSIPNMVGWRWVHTPGHTLGHISLFREEDRFLIAGDAFVTVKQESLYKVFVQELEISGPPKYFTTDWNAAKASVKKIEALNPKSAITGHGVPLAGEELANELHRLVEEFDEIAIPKHGRYVH